ncbi:glyoxalase superfamily protein [Planktotalea sp.]|uniref:glyoxalase superfamily protein n=1 Tax=Planktotalea sp. TaxID=2029877 RepID=UPI0032971093
MNPTTPFRSASVFRSFNEELAKAFYVDWLGFTIDFEHRTSPDAPLYLGLHLGQFSLHLSEHYGDCAPGGMVMIWLPNLTDWHSEIIAKPYPNNRPGLVNEPFGLCMTLSDPFFNRLRFVQSGTA